MAKVNISRRSQLLSGVAMAMLAASPAMAASSKVRDNSVNSTTVLGNLGNYAIGFETVYGYPVQTGVVSATVQTAQGDLTRTDTWNGTTLASSNSLAMNTLKARAIGNSFDNSAPAILLDSGLATYVVDGGSEAGTVEGIASLGVALNSGQITSLVDNGSISVSLTNAPLDSAENVSNEISATTTINQGVSDVSGQIPNNFSSTTGGSAFVNQFADTWQEAGPVNYEDRLSSQGTIVVSSFQQALPTFDSSRATASNNDITLDFINTGAFDTEVSGSGTLDNNSITATFAANSSTNTVSIEAGANPTFAGSAAMTTSQIYGGNPYGEVGTHQAYNTNSLINAQVYTTGFGESTLVGSITVDGNTISSAASGNVSLGNALTLAGGMNLAGPTTGANLYLDDTGGQQDTNASGSLVVVSNQLNNPRGGFPGNAQISAFTANAEISADIEAMSGASLSVSGNTISAVGKGNNQGTTISTDGTVTSFVGGVALANQQSNESVDVWAVVDGSLVEAVSGNANNNGRTIDSSVLVEDNIVSAAAYGNQGTNAINISATSLNAGYTGNVTLDAQTEGDTWGSGSILLGSSQTSFESDVTAGNYGSRIVLDSQDDAFNSGDTFTVGGNKQEAVAVSNLVSNSIDLKATTIGSGVGITSQQIVEQNSFVKAELYSSANIYVNEDVGDGGGSTVSLIDNMARAVAYGSSAANALSIEATTANISNGGNLASSLDTSHLAYSWVNSAYGVLNSQLTNEGVSAIVRPNSNSWSNYELFVDLDLQEGSAVHNDRNTSLAAAYGASANNVLTLNANSVTASGLDQAIAIVANAQYLDNEADVTAQVSPDGDAVILTYVSEDVFGGSSITTSDNTVNAQALGNTAVNALDVNATSISANYGDASVAFESDFESVEADIAIGINSVQRTDWGTAAMATLRDSFSAPGLSTEIRTVAFGGEGGEIADSSVVSIGNDLLATAGANRVDNIIELVTTSMNAPVGVNNYQRTDGQTVATIGLEGTPAVPATTSTYLGAGSTSLGGSAGYQTTFAEAGATRTLTVADGETVNLAQGAMTAGEWAALVTYLTSTVPGNKWIESSPGVLSTQGDGAYDISVFTGFGHSTGSLGTGIAAYAGFSFGGQAGNLGSGGIFIETNSVIDNSTLRVDANKVAGRAIGNEASNTLSVTATSIAQSAANTIAHTHDWDNEAAFGIGNWQYASESSDSIVEVFNTFAIDQEANRSITNSLLSVSDNNQSATAVANLAESSLSLSATDLASSPTTAGISSEQETWSFDGSAANVSAHSNMQVFAPIQSTGATIQLNDNTNSALGVHNDAKNTLSVTGTNIASVSDQAADPGFYMNEVTYADFALNNLQKSAGTLSTTAETSVFNQELANINDLETNGVITGTVEVNGNRTFAESSANRATNGVLIEGVANQGATAALANHQQSNTTVSASATSNLNIGLNGTDAVDAINDRAPLDRSSISMAGNVTQALARGNTASNTMVSAAGANYPALPPVASNSGTYNENTRASAAVLNTQDNYGSVAATATATYTVVLNSAFSTPSVSTGSIGVTNNSVAAVAYGNQATNKLTLTPLNSGNATGAIGSTQYNSGAISATSMSASFAIRAASGVTNGSTFRGTSNSVTATAVGNSVVSAITTGR